MKYVFLMGMLLVFLACKKNEEALPEVYVKDVADPEIVLNGEWEVSTELSDEFWKTQDTLSWSDVKLPGELMMQRIAIQSDKPFLYRKEIHVPEDYEQKRIYLQFDGVYSYARLWVNGKYIRDHHGGFTRWKAEITDYVKPGDEALILLEVTDRADNISYASGYAKHQIGGILRDVKLLALPENPLGKLVIETDLDSSFTDAVLRVSGKFLKEAKGTKVQISLKNPEGKMIHLNEPVLTLNKNNRFKIENPISRPAKWDAEHPNLYKLRVSLIQDDKIIWSQNTDVGFREVRVEENKLIVNGRPVKLRGANRHDVHPSLGRVSTPEYELKDILLAKEANMNYIRTSHYPPTEDFLKLCDKYGLYVEQETAICFVIPGYRIEGYEEASNSQSDPDYTDRYLSQLEEMVTANRNHPSVVIWSIGNESNYGSNFKKSYEWVQNNDSTRPIMFSYPGTVFDSVQKPYQILSMHYPPVDGNLTQYDIQTKNFGYEKMPVIFDEWAHVACYNNETIIEDPNTRNFWGQSLDRMWTKTFEANGGLGGAIWGMIDETFMLPENLEGFRKWWGIEDNTVQTYKGTTVGYGEWGIVDVWRRKKPEFWNTKKAYSPIRIMTTTIEDYKEGNVLKIPVYNRFDHTNLDEVILVYTYNGEPKTLAPFDLSLHTQGEISLPITNWKADKKITMEFYDKNKKLIDRYQLSQKQEKTTRRITADEKVKISKDHNVVKFSTGNGIIFLDATTGLITNIEKDGDNLAVSGPQMVYRTKGEAISYSSNKINNYSENWHLNDINYALDKNEGLVTINGSYNSIKATLKIRIFYDGKIKTSYSFQDLPKEYVREVGVKYILEDAITAVSWKRDGYWSAYPENHLSALSGKTNLYPLTDYRQKPEKPWNEDSKSFYYEGTNTGNISDLTRIAKATKENIYEYSLWENNDKIITVDGNGLLSCRLSKDNGHLELHLLNKLDYIDLSWGNYQRNILLGGSYKGKAEFALFPD